VSGAEAQLEFHLPGTGAPWPYSDEQLYFPSGANHAGELRGFLEMGCNVGFSVPELGEEAFAELKEQARMWNLVREPATGGVRALAPIDTAWRAPYPLLFGDTGAFGEIEFGAYGPEVVAPITEEDWEHRLQVLLMVAGWWGSSFFAVAPDQVGSQEETLARLRRYRQHVLDLRALGANIIVPVQRGRLDLWSFWREARGTLDLPPPAEDLPDEGLIAGITGNKDATSPEELELFAMARVGELAQTTDPEDLERLFTRPPPLMFHLLGCGPRNPRYPVLVQAIKRACPWAAIFSDACRLRAMTGRPGRDGRKSPRLLTQVQDEVLAEGELDGTADVKAEALERALQRERMRRYERAIRLGWRPG
jgi:hypothetical protein